MSGRPFPFTYILFLLWVWGLSCVYFYQLSISISRLFTYSYSIQPIRAVIHFNQDYGKWLNEYIMLNYLLSFCDD